MKKKIIYLSFILVLVISLITLSSIYKSKDNKYKKEYNTISKGMAIMIKEKGATDYVQSNSKDIPKGNYILNEEKTHCENNGKVTNYDSATGKISLNFIGSDRCYLYFDYKKETIKLGNAELVVNSETPDFSKVATTNEGLFKAQDDLGTSYYFRGAVDNNWVKFGQESILSCTYNDEQVNGGKYDRGNGRIYNIYKISTQSECSGSGVCISRNFGPVIGVSSSDCSHDGGTWVNSPPIYGGLKKESIFWRIIRINGDGSIRMIYTGTTAPTESTKVVMTGKGTQIDAINYFFNVDSDKAENLGYQYIEGQQHGYGKCNGTSASCPVNGGTVYNSRIKQEIDKWYAETTLKDNDLIADQIFCNDRSASTSDVAYSNTNYTTLTSWNSTGTEYYYGARGRLYKSKSPQLICPIASDKFTVNTSNGNGALTYPVGLITADEVAMAGGVFITDNSSYYLYTNKDYWLGSPDFFDSSTSFDYGFHVDSSGYLSRNLVSSTRGVRPVISLSSKAKLSGSGTYNDVYTVVGENDSTEDTPSGKSFDTIFAANDTDIFNENGYRYEGADPNNYICLDNKTSGACSDSSLLFRIIGLFDEDTSSNGTSSSGTKKLLKVIDTNNYGGTSGKVWNSAGRNNWSTASLKTELNETYLTNLLGASNVNSKLSSGIINAKWHLGGGGSSNSNTLTAEGIYREERNTSAIHSGNPSSIYAKVGLMYPSDYGYATVGGSTTNKSNCRGQALYNWSNSSYSYCKNNDWLYTSQSSFVNSGEWLLSPYSSNSTLVAYLGSAGVVYLSNFYNVGQYQYAVRPTFYLDSSILKIVGAGDGTKDNAYRVG